MSERVWDRRQGVEMIDPAIAFAAISTSATEIGRAGASERGAVAVIRRC
jgi:hypothetical protein